MDFKINSTHIIFKEILEKGWIIIIISSIKNRITANENDIENTKGILKGIIKKTN